MDNNFKTVTLPLGALLLTAILALGALIGYSHSLLRADISDLRGEVSVMRGEVSVMRGELAGVRERLARVEVLVEANGKARPQAGAVGTAAARNGQIRRIAQTADHRGS